MKKNFYSKHSSLLTTMLLLCIFTIPSLAQDIIPIPAHGSNFSTYSRGFWFTAPCDMMITGFRAPTDFSTSNQAIHVVKFPTTPVSWPDTTNSFTTLFYGSNITDTCFVDMNIPVQAGDFIGIIAIRGGVTSYSSGGSPIASTVGPFNISLARLGFQGNINSGPATSFFTETGGSIGRAEIRYEQLPPATIPTPSHGTTFSGNSRGFWFTAPTSFVITGIRAPKDFNTNAQTIHLVKFPSIPPTWSTTTTSFTTLFYASGINDTGYVDVSIPVSSGDIIGIIAVRDNGSGGSQTSYTSATSPISSNIGSFPITLARLGHQGNIISGAATDFWTESGNPIGRADIRYEMPAFYKYTHSSIISNTIPFNTAPSSNNKRQWIYHPSDFSCTPTGYITKIYLKASASVTPSFSGLLIRMGLTTLNAFTSTNFVTALDTVLYASTIDLGTITGDWIPIELDKPFYYDGNSNFILEASHQGFTTGFSVMQTNTGVVGRSLFGNSGNATGSIQDRLANFGFELLTVMDAGLETFTLFPDTFCQGVRPIAVTLKNYGPLDLLNAEINWEVNGSPQAPYAWTGNLTPNSSSLVTLANFNFLPSTSYTVKAYVTDPNGLDDIMNANDTIEKVDAYSQANPVVNLGTDITIKMGSNVTLDAGPGFSTYHWSTGATTQTIVVDSTGTGVGIKTIWVEVGDQYSCPGSDTIKITFLDDSGIEEAIENARFNLYPNPSEGLVELSMNQFPSGDYIITLLSIDGSEIFRKVTTITTDNHKLECDLSTLPDGLFFIRINGVEGCITKKLVISK